MQLNDKNPLGLTTLVIRFEGVDCSGTISLSWIFVVAVAALTVVMRQKFQDVPSAPLLVMADLLPRAGYALGLSIQKLLLPFGLSPFYGMPAHEAVWFPFFAFAVPFLGLVLWLSRRQRGGLFLLAAFLAGLAPALGLIKLGRFVAADRYTYFASLALAPLIAGWLRHVFLTGSRLRNGVLMSGVIAGIGFLGSLSSQQTSIWRDSGSLWHHALMNGGALLADVHSNYGGALESAGLFPQALASYDRAIALDPFFPDAHLGRGVVLYRLGRLDEAIAEARGAIKYGGDYALAWHNLAAFLAAKKDRGEVHEVLEKALVLSPGSPDLLYLKAQLQAEGGQYAEALRLFRHVALVKPAWVDPHIAWGAMHALLGDKGEARRVLRDVLQQHPENAAARATLDQVEASVRHREAQAIPPGGP